MEKLWIGDLAADFANWGRSRINRILRLTKKYGVLCSGSVFSTGKKG